MGIILTPPSADGRYLAFYDKHTGDVAIRDLKENTSRRITNAAGSGERADYMVVSPDGRQVVYGWSTKTGYELRILPVAGAESTKPKIVYRSAESPYVQPWAWMPDGKSVLVVRYLKDRAWQIASIAIADGSLRMLKSIGSNAPYRVSVSPDGRYIAYDLPVSESSPARDIFMMTADGSREITVATSPANDTEPMWSPDGSQLIFVSDRSGKPSLWSVPIEAGTPKSPPELINVEIPANFYAMGMTISGALYFGANVGVTNVYTADLDEKLNLKSEPVRIGDRGINANTRPGWSPDGQYLAYVSYRSDSRVLVIRSLNTGEERELPSSLPQNGFAGPLTWFPDGRSVLVTSIDEQKGRIGYYRVNINSGGTELLHFTSTRGISQQRPDLSPDGNTIFHGDVDAGGPKLVRFDIDTGHETILKRWPAARFVTSVAVSPDGSQLAYTVS